MLKFRVHEMLVDRAEAVTRRFVNRVNDLLPTGWRFQISPMPRREDGVSSHPALPSTYVPVRLVEGTGSLRQVGRGSASGPQDWRHRFRLALSDLIGRSATATFYLVDGRDNIFIDSYMSRQLDVADLERTTAEAAAGALIHALEENIQGGDSDLYPDYLERPGPGGSIRTSHRTGQLETALAAHREAIWTEASVMGGVRMDDEARSRPPGYSPGDAPPGQRYEFYEPYLMADDSIRAVMFRMEGRTILGSDIVTFRSLAAFQAALPG